MVGKLFLSVLLLLVVACPRATNSQSIENAAIEREEYAVYSAMVVDYVFARPPTIVIANPTSNLTRANKVSDLRFVSLTGASSSLALSQETLEDFINRNKSNRWLKPKFEISRKYVFVDFREIKRLANDFQHGDFEWKAFSKKYPESYGFVTLSRVGFNKQMDQALIYIQWRCPGMCGEQSYQLLAKKDGIWKVVGDANRLSS